MELLPVIESIVFVAAEPVSPAFILEVLNGTPETGAAGEAAAEPPHLWERPVTEDEVEAGLEALLKKYQDGIYPFEVRQLAGGYQFLTKRSFYPYVRRTVVQKNQKRLSRAALETLSIIAYRQPITKAEMEFIRGVNCDYAVQKLLDKQLIQITGRADGPGRPLLYGTSPFFMQYFGINEVSDLPKLKEFEDLAEDHMDLFRQHQEQKENHGQEDAEPRQERETLLGEGTQENGEEA
ncbi:MAG: SMC-Scp complex subunit ScpB [Bacteroidetes bacterium]|nr:MAG: SMC-Scp complex subunit ScpB [Bacteroidota bacterium]